MKSRKGFTLVEIMIVVVIIGLLVAMATPMWQKIRRYSQDKTITNNLRQLYAASQQYFLEQGADTAQFDDLVGTEEGKYIKSVATVRGEDYTALIFAANADSLTIGTGDDAVTYPPAP